MMPRNFLQRLKHGLSWRWERLESQIRIALVHIGLALRWHIRRKVRPHNLSAPLIVSLTSYPARFSTLAYTLRSLLRQTVKADHTILWVAHKDMAALPKDVLDLQKEGLEIRATDDTKSYKKILPVLDEYPNAYICTADDDLYYWATWLKELVENVNAEQRIVPCHRAHEIMLDPQGSFHPYEEWNIHTEFRGERNNLFPTNGAGTLFPPGILAHKQEDRDAAFRLCPQGDDIWLYWIGRKNGARYKTVGRWRDLIMWDGSQDETMWHENVLRGGNDEQIQKMAEKYGYP